MRMGLRPSHKIHILVGIKYVRSARVAGTSIFCRVNVCLPLSVYMVSQEECARLRESVPYVKVYRYNPKHLYPKLNGYGDMSPPGFPLAHWGSRESRRKPRVGTISPKYLTKAHEGSDPESE